MDKWTLTPRSSHIAALSWEPEGEIPTFAGAVRYGNLYVAFKNGKIYSYEGISEDDFRTVRVAQSVGGALFRLGITNPRGRRTTRIGDFDPEKGDFPNG